MERVDAGTPRHPPQHGRIDDVEVLRAFAVGMVLVQHVPWNLLPWMLARAGPLYSRFGFHVGVDLFLAISGFVIARSLLPQLAEARTTRQFATVTLSFWVRRVFRLLPTAWLWLAVMLLLARVFNSSGVFEPFAANLKSAAFAMLNLANVWLAECFGRRPVGVVSIYWTLSLEEQFYILLPFVVFLSRSKLPLVLAAIVLAQLFVDRTTKHLLLDLLRSDALAIGVLLAIWSGRPSYLKLEPKWLGRGAWPFLLAPVFLVGFTALNGPVLARFFTVGLTALLSAGMVWIASYDRGFVMPAGRRCAGWGRDPMRST
jgi:peptidoglycan/LPS O-acetylase OafA/YrhL